ncbi:MAG: hypothetical protein MUE60_04440 [Candidatus Eisenbacteria bacterium]|jgi:hypothetical protein|nr:hypothetical protein [Candidatus Eisenbacteria bacterium]
MISEDVVRQALEEASDYSQAQATSVVESIAEAQPELFSFVVELTEDLSEETVNVALQMFVTIMRAYELGSPEPVRRIDRRAMTRAYNRNEEMLEALTDAAKAGMSERADPPPLRQPHLMRFLVETVMEDEEQFTAEESGMLFLVLKTVIDAVDTAAKPLRRKPRLGLVTKE